MGDAVDRLVALSQVSGYTKKDGTRVRSYFRTEFANASFADKPTPKRFVMAKALSGKTIGHIGWYTDPERRGEIFDVRVEPEYRRMGIATELFDAAKKDEPSLRHSEALSDDARKWIAGMKRKRRSRYFGHG